MLSIASGALAGVCCVLLAPRLPALWACVSTCALFAVLGFALRWRWLPALAVGIACAAVDAHARMSDWLARNLESEKITVTGVVCSVPQLKPQGVRFQFEVETPRGLPRIVELSWYEANTIPRSAEHWSLEVRLRRPRGFANPGGSDLAARLLRDRIGATGYVRSGQRLPARAGDGLRWPVLRLRAQIADSVRGALGARPATGIIVGLAVGLQDALSTEQWQALSRSGTSHLMAISGLHIGMVAAVFAWFARVLWRRCQLRGARGATRDAAVIAGTVAAAAYSALAGASVPTQRTLIMIAVAAAAFHRRRNASVVDGLSVAVLAVLALDPLAPLAPGFWLSFGAVAAIVSVMSGHIVRPSAWVTWMTPQLAVTVGLVPVLAYAFGGVSIVSAVVNLPAIPLYTLVIVPWTLLGSTVALIDPDWGRVALDPLAWLIEWSWPMISVPAHWPLALWTVAAPGVWGGALMIIGVAASLMPLGAAARGAGAAIVVCVCTWPPSVPPPGHAHVAVLDVGQGLAVVIRTQHHALVYDTGPAFRSGSDTGQLVVVPYLRARGVRVVDALVVSHDDADHAGGARSVIESIAVKERIASGRALDQFPIVRRCSAGWTWVWDGVRFEWMNREPGADARDNDRSCVLLVEAQGRRLLLTGDIEARGESRLLEQRRLPRVDVVVVPHHGSRSSSSRDFVARTAPRWAIVSAGYLNRWGFPRPEVVSRWRDAGAEVLTTADSGAIEFELGTGPLGTPHRFRLERRHFWQEQ